MYYLVQWHTEYIIDVWLFKYINSRGVKVSLLREPNNNKKHPTDLELVKLLMKGAEDNQLCVSFTSWKDQSLNEYPWENYPIENVLKKLISPKRRKPPTEE